MYIDIFNPTATNLTEVVNVRGYLRLLKEEEIARRYFIMNSFDGILTIFGVILGMYIVGVHDAKILIVSCFTAAVAMAVSGIWGAYVTEHAERVREVKELGAYLLIDLKDTRIGKNAEIMSLIVAVVDGMSPLLMSLILLVPFILTYFILSIDTAYQLSFILVLIMLFLLGAVVGKIEKASAIKSGLKMVFAGLTVGLLVFFLEVVRLF